MSKEIRAEIDQMQIENIDQLYDLINLIKQHILQDQLYEYKIDVNLQENAVILQRHTWDYIKIYTNGEVIYDNHFGHTEHIVQQLQNEIKEWQNQIVTAHKIIDQMPEKTKRKIKNINFGIDKTKKQVLIEITEKN